MSYCIVQTELTALPVDRIKQSFRLLKGFTEADAIKLARDCFGLLQKGLSVDVAQAMERALASQGLAVQMVEESQLPRLPDAKFIRRLEIHDTQLIVFDPLGRPLPVGLEHLQLIAVGAVQHFQLHQSQTQGLRMEYSLVHGPQFKVVTEQRHQVKDQTQFVLDLLLARASLRLQIEADNFVYRSLFDRPELELPGKVSCLVQLLAQHAPHAILNRGATQMRAQSPEVQSYPSKAALFDEERWLLWLHQNHP